MCVWTKKRGNEGDDVYYYIRWRLKLEGEADFYSQHFVGEKTKLTHHQTESRESQTSPVLRARTEQSVSNHSGGMSESTGLGKRAAAEDAEEGDKLYRFAVDWPRKVSAARESLQR